MEIKKTPTEIFKEYETGKEYNTNIELYDNVEKNNKFFLGDQWYGVNAPNLMKPVFNIIKRVVSYFTAMLVSDDVGVDIRPFSDDTQQKAYADIVSDEILAVIERTKTKQKARTNIKNACIDGDTAVFVNFDPDIDTNQQVTGDIVTEIIDNTHIIFGNPYSDDVQSQPYILVVQRLYNAQVKDMAKELGVGEEEIKKIVPDDDNFDTGEENQSDNSLTTVITKFWKVKSEVEQRDPNVPNMTITKKVTSVHFTKCTGQVTLQEETDTGLKLYPIAWFSWEKVKNSYHGRSPVTGLIPNQVFINKIYAMCMVYMTNMGFPKIFYDQNKIAKLTNNVSTATAVTNLDLAGKMIDAVKAPDFSTQIMSLCDSVIAYTKDFMGASDAALGNISNPNNTSAIVAVQQASSVPLEVQKLDYYQFFEDIIRIMIDVISCKYGTRYVHITESEAKALNLIDHIEFIDKFTGQPSINPLTGQAMPTENTSEKIVYKSYTQIDFSQLKNFNYDLNVEIGASSYWSEATAIQTLDNMFDRGIVTDPVDYLESIPDKYVPNKKRLIESVKSARQETQLTASAPVLNTESQMPLGDGVDTVDNRAAEGYENDEMLQQVYKTAKDTFGGRSGETINKS